MVALLCDSVGGKCRKCLQWCEVGASLHDGWKQHDLQKMVSLQCDSILVGDETGLSTSKAESDRSSMYKHIGCKATS
jgi:hypothetical protein